MVVLEEIKIYFNDGLGVQYRKQSFLSHDIYIYMLDDDTCIPLTLMCNTLRIFFFFWQITKEEEHGVCELGHG